ncbi:MAG: RNA-dependent DNA polymerase [Chloroflexi bacterium]|nr:MAG: RNA-dependent DNA polymerase [Chloroflexota bacterium]
MYKKDLYILAYERIKSAPGNMTPGTDGKTLDGFSPRMIDEIIEQMQTEQFQFKPVRTVYIPKANGKKRKLGIPSTRDKIVQEVIRLLLECIYESPSGPYFHDASHGFRPNRSCHTALCEIRAKWPGLNWFVEGDIRACFDEIEHGILVSLLRKKIQDERFLNLIWKLLRAGYFDMQGDSHENHAGTPQGGLASPILANIYLHELDEKVQEIQARENRGEGQKRRNPQYVRLQSQKRRLVKKGATRTKTFRALVKQIRSIPSGVVKDPDFIRIKYIRYADDWIIGISGPHKLAVQIKEELATFLHQRLALTLSTEKTKITPARKGQARFLGTNLQIGRKGEPRIVTSRNSISRRPIRRRSTGWEILMTAPMASLINKLHTKGFCTAKGRPITKTQWLHLEAEQMILLFNGINRGIQNSYRFADNFSRLGRIQYILQFSLAHTLAAKYKCTIGQIFKRYGKAPTVRIKTPDGKQERTVTFYYNHDWKKRRYGFMRNYNKVDPLQWSMKLRARSRLGMPCCICISKSDVEMHHVRHIRKIGEKEPTGINALLRQLNRKQLPVCAPCHQRIHRGEYDHLRLSDLAYNPYPNHRRRGSLRAVCSDKLPVRFGMGGPRS